MSYESKRDWISLIGPIALITVVYFLPRPEVLDNIYGFFLILILFIIFQLSLGSLLNKVFPVSEDLRDDWYQ